VKKHLIKACQPILNKCGLHLLRAQDFDKQQQREQLLTNLINRPTVSHKEDPAPPELEFIIFSKDRALQLHGLLQSLLRHVQGTFSIQILYHASSQAHQNAYQDIKRLLSQQDQIHWKQEHNFQADLIHILDNSQSTKICFLVDDIVFTRPINLDSLNWSRYSEGILSLRLGEGINYCYTKDRSMTVPPLTNSNETGDILEFSWSDSTLDWAYPLSVDGHVFSTSEIRVAVHSLHFTAPNSFERALQILTPLYAQRPGYCFTQPRLVNIPLNRVQNENYNISGDISPDQLLQRWKEGKTLDIEALTAIETNSVHQEIPISFCRR